MSQYSYHNRIKQRISNNEFLRAEYIKNMKIGKEVFELGLMLHFNTYPFTRPIRPHRFEDYKFITE